MDTIQDPTLEMFTCKRYRDDCRMTIRACVIRQHAAKNGNKSEKMMAEKCLKCNIGDQHKIKFKAAGGVIGKIKSERRVKPKHYPDKKEEKPVVEEETTPSSPENHTPQEDGKRQCEICEEWLDLNEENFRPLAKRITNETNKGFTSKCKGCIQKNLVKGHQKVKDEKPPVPVEDQKSEPKQIQIQEDPISKVLEQYKAPEGCLLVNFSELPDLIKDVEIVAKEELRKVNETILYAIRNYTRKQLKKIKEHKDD